MKERKKEILKVAITIIFFISVIVIFVINCLSVYPNIDQHRFYKMKDYSFEGMLKFHFYFNIVINIFFIIGVILTLIFNDFNPLLILGFMLLGVEYFYYFVWGVVAGFSLGGENAGLLTFLIPISWIEGLIVTAILGILIFLICNFLEKVSILNKQIIQRKKKIKHIKRKIDKYEKEGYEPSDELKKLLK